MSRRGNCHDNAVVESLLAFGPLRIQPAQARAYTAADLSLTRRGQAGCVRLHIDVLQPDTQACKERDAVARRVRTVADDEHRGRLENPALFILQALADGDSPSQVKAIGMTWMKVRNCHRHHVERTAAFGIILG